MFESARLKIERANQHIVDFNNAVSAFAKTDFYSFSIETDPDSGKNFLQFRFVEAPPKALALTLGDATHNLRSSLDHAYVELAKLAGKNPTKWTSFRVWENRKALVNSLSNGIFQGENKIIDVLADDIRAYIGGNKPLEDLDRLDQRDKHVLILPVFTVGSLDQIDATIKVGTSNIIIRGASVIVDDSGVLRYMGFGSQAVEMELHNKGKPSFGVFFGDGTNLKGKPIIPTLAQFSQLVDGIISIFESIINSRGS